MENTKNKQIVALVLGIVSFALPNVSSAIGNSVDTSTSEGTLGFLIFSIIISLAALIVGIIGILKSSAARKEAREAKNWDAGDKIRVALDKAGIVLKDSKEGTTWELKG